MDKDDILKAKEIFLKYGGNHFHMERDGEYENYKKFSISDTQESLWLNDYQNELLKKVEVEDIASYYFSQLIDVLRLSKNILYFQALLEIVEKKQDILDTFSQLLMSEGILNTLDSFKENTEAEDVKIIFEAKKLALSILINSMQRPITVASYFKNVDYLQDVITEDKILNRIKNTIRKWK